MIRAIDPMRWERIQRLERAYQDRKRPEQTLQINRIYWRRILERVAAAGVEFGPRTRILDMGCGGAGILLALDQGQRTGVDPLMEHYLARFPHLAAAPVRWLSGTAEDHQANRPYQVVFSINSLDHVRAPARAAENLARLVAPGGHLVLVVNAHTSRLVQSYFARFQRLLDPPHPHHFHRDDLPGLFGELSLVTRQDIDSLWLDLEPRYRSEALADEPAPPLDAAGLLSLVLRVPLVAARLLGRPVHRRRPGQRPLIASNLYLLRRPGEVD